MLIEKESQTKGKEVTDGTRGTGWRRIRRGMRDEKVILKCLLQSEKCQSV